MQRIQAVNLSKLKKCDQVWVEMPESERGKICQKCQQTIIDFRKLNDSEVAELHIFNEGKVCGLYRKDQLRGLKDKKTSGLKVRSIMAGIIGFLSTLNAKAQTETKVVKTEQTEQTFNDNNQITTDSLVSKTAKDNIIISGIIKDNMGNPAINAAVYIEGTIIGTTSDHYGNYSLNVTESFENMSEITLVYSFIGYTEQKEILSKNKMMESKNRLINVVLHESNDLISFYVVQKQPLHKRIWKGIKSIFKKER